MIYDIFDELAYNNKRLSIFCSKKIKRMLNLKYFKCITFVLAATMAASFWQFENYYPWVEPVKVFASVFALAIWIYASFISGFKRRKSFVFFILSYWFIPQVFIIWFSSTPIAEYNSVLDLLSVISNTLVHSPVLFITKAFAVNWHIVVIILVAVCELSYAAGYNFRYSLRKSAWYREFREHYHNN